MPPPRVTNLRIAKLEVEVWNLKYPVGTPVTVRKDSGELVETKTKYPAEVSASGHAVGWFEGIPGYYLLERAHPEKEAQP